MTRHEREEARKSLDPLNWRDYDGYEGRLEARSGYLEPALDEIDKLYSFLRIARDIIADVPVDKEHRTYRRAIDFCKLVDPTLNEE